MAKSYKEKFFWRGVMRVALLCYYDTLLASFLAIHNFSNTNAFLSMTNAIAIILLLS